MITGTVNGRREATIPLTLWGPNGATATVVAVIDTGYSGFLILPTDVVQQLSLVSKSAGRATLADGSVRVHDTYAADLEWDGQMLAIPVSTIGPDVLAGMRLLEGHRLTVDVSPGGAVEIVPLSPPAPPPTL